ncbi:MAG: hypothetical protein ABIL51_07485 [candidate division WOR-3 bacterium]
MLNIMFSVLTIEPFKLAKPEDIYEIAQKEKPFYLITVYPSLDTTPSDSGKVWIGYTPKELVIYAKLYQKEINAQSKRRDAQTLSAGQEDFIGVVILPSGWGKVSEIYQIKVNPLGNIADMSPEGEWDSDTRVLSKIYDWGYEVMILIPFKSIPFSSPGWGFNIVRAIISNMNIQMLTNNPDFTYDKHAKMVFDYEYIQKPRAYGFTLIPSFRLESEFDTVRNNRPLIGATLRYKRGTSDLMDITAKPDFSDVDVDIITFNLNRLPADYPEKRPFFVEGKPYSPPSILLRTRNLEYPLYGMKFYSAYENQKFYLGYVKDTTFNDVYFGNYQYNLSPNTVLNASFVNGLYAYTTTFGGGLNFYDNRTAAGMSLKGYKNFSTDAQYNFLYLYRSGQRLNIYLSLTRVQSGFLTPLNYISLYFDGYKSINGGFYYSYTNDKIFNGKNLFVGTGFNYSNMKTDTGKLYEWKLPVIYEWGNTYINFLILPSPIIPLNLFGIYTSYSYMPYLADYLPFEDLTQKSIGITFGYFINPNKEAIISFSSGKYLGYPLRGFDVSISYPLGPFQPGISYNKYETILDTLQIFQVYGYIYLPYHITVKPYVGYTADEVSDTYHLNGNLVIAFEPKQFWGIYFAVNKQLFGDEPQRITHLFEKEVFKVQVAIGF